MRQLLARELETPLGAMFAAAVIENEAAGLMYLDFVDEKQERQALAAKWQRVYGVAVQMGQHELLEACQTQLEDYFCGKRRDFSLSLAPQGTPFQQQVWQLLCQIPYGKTWTYSEQAARLGNPKALRAVAAANGRNPLSIIVPCHRVIGKSGGLVGYTGGLHRKAFLLDLEQRYLTIE